MHHALNDYPPIPTNLWRSLVVLGATSLLLRTREFFSDFDDEGLQALAHLLVLLIGVSWRRPEMVAFPGEETQSAPAETLIVDQLVFILNQCLGIILGR